jgi:Protein of unknown function DUF262
MQTGDRMLTNDDAKKLEEQITEQKKTVDFDTREFTIEFLVQKYLTKIDQDENDIFVPEYQREFVWDDSRQSRLVESIVLGLPIPIIFLAEDTNGRLEIVDGSQRIRTLAAFLSNELTLEDLEKLTRLNGLQYKDLPESRKRKINNTPIRMIVLSEAASEGVRNDLFERINRGSDLLRSMEKRKGIYRGEFNKFIYNVCAKDPLLSQLTPLAKSVENRQELEELVLRYFALMDQYPNFKTHRSGIGSVLDDYMQDRNASFTAAEATAKSAQLAQMLNFVKQAFPNGFAKQKERGVSRVFFEAVSVGVSLALTAKPDLKPTPVNVHHWLRDEAFNSIISGKYKTHTPPKIRQRVEFVRDRLLEMAGV